MSLEESQELPGAALKLGPGKTVTEDAGRWDR